MAGCHLPRAEAACFKGHGIPFPGNGNLTIEKYDVQGEHWIVKGSTRNVTFLDYMVAKRNLQQRFVWPVNFVSFFNQLSLGHKSNYAQLLW